MKRGVFGFGIVGVDLGGGEVGCAGVAPYRGIAQNAAHGRQSAFRSRPRRRRRSIPRRAAALAPARCCRGARPAPRTTCAPWPAGRPVPAARPRRPRRQALALEALAGRVVVLNFWATWCEPCRIEMPSLDAMAARRQREGVVVVAVNYHEAPDVIRRFLERFAVHGADPARQRWRRHCRLDAARFSEHRADRPQRRAGAHRRRRTRLGRRRGARAARSAGRGARARRPLRRAAAERRRARR